ncbi:cysteine desulfurase family protein [Aureimonas sp. SA4125]|uniref:cysteine desulfurase family protein n=1 Tax=Aureimonas sp. SA4125 TaxID=2826993 RepID=UPI001CC34343|nr:cysteine desulfurase family protein [Aureimonas sp. SA4125]
MDLMTERDRRIYLDYNSGAPLLPEARAALIDSADLAGNPSSVHAEGRRAYAVVEEARRRVARLVGADPEHLVFTSGATEAAATCLTPEWVMGDQIVTLGALAVADTDHPATREGGRFAPSAVSRLPVDAQGQLRLDALGRWCDGLASGNRAMLCLTLANSETGILQDLAPIRETIAGSGVLLVLDVVQAAGRLPLAISDLGADALLLSGHKIGAAKGIGAYALADGACRPTPLLTGGGQERRHRGGTQAVALIASFGAAASVAADRLADAEGRLNTLAERLLARLGGVAAPWKLLGSDSAKLANTFAITLPGLNAETAQMGLDLAGFAVSAGSACSSGKVGASHVLNAMKAGGLDIDASAGAIRISFGYETTSEEIDLFAAAFGRLAERVGKATSGLRAA